MNRTSRVATSLCVLSLLAACRIGDVWPFGSSASTTPFPVKQAISGFLSDGLDRSLSASGTIARGNESVKFSGQVNYSVKRAVPATFGGTPALMVADTFGGTFSVSGQPIEVGTTGVIYLNAGHDLIGDSAAGRYCVADAPGVIPAAVTAGQSGTLASYTCYTSNQRASRAGTRTDNWFASAGPRSGTLKFRVVSVSTDDTGETIGTASKTYLIRGDGSLSISEIQIVATQQGITTRLTAN